MNELGMRFCQTAVIVDDEPLLALDLQVLCEELGCEVLAVAYSAAQAEERFADLAPEAILTDMDLGKGLDGVDVVENLRPRHPDMRVIFVTGATGTRALARLEKTPSNALIRKPITKKELERALRVE